MTKRTKRKTSSKYILTLDEFLKADYLHNAYVDEEGFSELDVRKSTRYINDQRIETLDIARVAATSPGKGTFSKLVKRLHPNYNLYVECVSTKHFEKALTHLGFTKHTTGCLGLYGLPSYYLLKEDKP